ncbi:MAG: FAD-binding protein [Coriobacteriia bacterium]|nr:FAD-binding protein [Coriobacteriia bacterium]MBS5478628.1 FAD-binding protein [Coriobacteriia bacterium]
MSYADRSLTSVSRRTFVQAAGVAAGALALGSIASGDARAAEKSSSDDSPALPKDGTYTTSASSFGWTGPMVCDVTFKDGKLTDIQVVSETDSATGEWFASARDLLIPRIIEKQSIAIDGIAGATVSSSAIMMCVAEALDAAGCTDNEAWHGDLPAEEKATQKLDGYDVVVVGLGGSGILSFCAAAYNGAKVFGMEAAGKVGGDSACTYGPMALNSEYLKALYTEGKDYIDEADVYDTWMSYVESDEKADVISEAVHRSGSSLDFFNENFGFEFEGRGLLGSFVRPDWDKLWCVYSADDGNTSWNALGPNKTFQFTRALDRAIELSPDSSYQTELRAEELIIDEAGIVTGVRATAYDGTPYEVYGKNIVLATGGFIGNADMMTEYLGAPTNTLGVTLNNGAGIQMGLAAGGALFGMKALPMIHISQVANIIRSDELTADQKAVLTALALTTEKPMVTIAGEPWGVPGDDGTAVTDVVYAPGYRYYVVYTQADIDGLKEKGLSETQATLTSMFINQGGALPAAGTPVSDIDDILAVGEKYLNVLSGEGAAGLAGVLDMDAATLEATLTDAGVDPTVKLYAVACCGYAYATVGGLNVDANMNVLREDGTPIENLYAVGQDSEGTCNADGKPYTPWGGQAQSWTFVSGQIAGTKAAGAEL